MAGILFKSSGNSIEYDETRIFECTWNICSGWYHFDAELILLIVQESLKYAHHQNVCKAKWAVYGTLKAFNYRVISI